MRIVVLLGLIAMVAGCDSGAPPSNPSAPGAPNLQPSQPAGSGAAPAKSLPAGGKNN